MTWLPIISIAVLALFLALGDVISKKTKGYISSLVFTILALLLFGGTLEWLPKDMFVITNISSIVGIIVIPLMIVNVGSMLDLNALKAEWKTVIVALAGLAGVIISLFTLGVSNFGHELAYSAAGPISGGVVATMIMTENANNFGRTDIAVFVAAIMGMQTLIGLPLASFCLAKAGKVYLVNKKNTRERRNSNNIHLRFIAQTPQIINTPNAHLARIAFSCFVAILLANFTGITTSITYLVVGIFFAAFGLLERNSLKLAGADGFCIFATWAFVLAPFVSMSLANFAEILPALFGLLIIATIGIIVFSIIAAVLLKWSPFLGVAVGLCCLMGYPYTQVLAEEVACGLTQGAEFTQEEKDNLLAYLLPKMLISGSVSVSIASVALAGVIAPLIFG